MPADIKKVGLLMSRWRVCSAVDCPVLHQGGGKCPDCRAESEKVRGSRHQRGYGYAHVVAGNAALAGVTECAVCGSTFSEENPATRGHKVAIRNGGTPADGYQAECQRCNYGWSSTGL